MSYLALYRKWRPLVFEDMVEQEHVVKTLRNSIITDRVAHAYLFCGTRGTGKTSMAQIFSRAINCLKPNKGDPCNQCEICSGILSGSILDVVEIDAASNNSVDNVRDIRDDVVYTPTQAKFKVYIIDEVHMLSTGAFNALLKTLEEPPPHVVFILATTEPHKLPATILSRCQRFDFRRISVESIMGRLDRIAADCGVILQKEAAKLIARISDGALRDAISILDQCVSVGNKEISFNNVLSVVGIVNDAFIADVVDAVVKKDINNIINLVERLVMDGKDIAHFIADLIFYFRNLLVCKTTGNPEDIIEADTETVERMKKQSADFTRDELICTIKELSSLESGLKWVAHPRISLEIALVRICENSYSSNNDSLLERMSVLERKVCSVEQKADMVDNIKSKVDVDTIKANPSEKDKNNRGRNVANESDSSGDKEDRKIENWSAILDELKSSGKTKIYANLTDTWAVELDNKTIGVIFPDGRSFNKMLVSRAESIEIIETAAAKALGREVRIKCLDEDEKRVSSKTKNDDDKNEFEEKAFEKKARDIAARTGISLNVIDE